MPKTIAMSKSLISTPPSQNEMAIIMKLNIMKYVRLERKKKKKGKKKKTRCMLWDLNFLKIGAE